MPKQLKITLTKSLIGRVPKHKVIAKQLGLGKMHSSVCQPNNPSIAGLINQISYLVKVEELTA